MSIAAEPALGLVETRGLIGAIEAADAMVKGAPVRLVRTVVTPAALVTVQVVGSVGAVYAAVSAGEHAAKRVGQLIASHIIPNPDGAVRTLLQLHKTNAGPAGHQAMTVQQLRAVARGIAEFPMTGREIARAKKGELLALLKTYG